MARKTAAKSAKAARTVASGRATTPVLLAGGNPQVPKADGDAPVQRYIEAIPGWKRDVARRLDALITRALGNVRKAVRWNSPFYGVEGPGWVVAFHCHTRYLKVAFFNGVSLHPVPPGESRQKRVRYLDIRENELLDEAQFTAWIKQASRMPGVPMTTASSR